MKCEINWPSTLLPPIKRLWHLTPVSLGWSVSRITQELINRFHQNLDERWVLTFHSLLLDLTCLRKKKNNLIRTGRDTWTSTLSFSVPHIRFPCQSPRATISFQNLYFLILYFSLCKCTSPAPAVCCTKESGHHDWLFRVDFPLNSSVCKFRAAQKIGVNLLTVGGRQSAPQPQNWCSSCRARQKNLGLGGLVLGQTSFFQEYLEYSFWWLCQPG